MRDIYGTTNVTGPVHNINGSQGMWSLPFFLEFQNLVVYDFSFGRDQEEIIIQSRSEIVMIIIQGKEEMATNIIQGKEEIATKIIQGSRN